MYALLIRVHTRSALDQGIPSRAVIPNVQAMCRPLPGADYDEGSVPWGSVLVGHPVFRLTSGLSIANIHSESH